MTFLLLDTTTRTCTVALLRDGEVLFSERQDAGQHAADLPVFVQMALQAAKDFSLSLDAVVLSAGPGSYTGLRIGTATAKGLCYGLDVPLLAIDTLQLLAAQALQPWFMEEHFGKATEEKVVLCPMIDARRMEVYCRLFTKTLQPLTDVEARVIDEQSFAEVLAENKVIFIGDGAAKCKAVIQHQNALFVDGIVPDVRQGWVLAKEAYERKQFVDLAYFEPNYLKEYQAVRSINKVLNTNT